MLSFRIFFNLFEKRLPEVALERSTRLQNKYDEMNGHIMKVPSTVPEFVEFRTHLQRYHDNEDNLEDLFSFVKNLYGVMAANSNYIFIWVDFMTNN